MLSHPAEVRIAHQPPLALLTELMTHADAAGKLQANVSARRMAALTMQTVMFVARSSGPTNEKHPPHHRR